ncbi:hypothetical protein Tco_0507495 [Tanacetum coccineum]
MGNPQGSHDETSQGSHYRILFKRIPSLQFADLCHVRSATNTSSKPTTHPYRVSTHVRSSFLAIRRPSNMPYPAKSENTGCNISETSRKIQDIPYFDTRNLDFKHLENTILNSRNSGL